MRGEHANIHTQTGEKSVSIKRTPLNWAHHKNFTTNKKRQIENRWTNLIEFWKVFSLIVKQTRLLQQPQNNSINFTNQRKSKWNVEINIQPNEWFNWWYSLSFGICVNWKSWKKSALAVFQCNRANSMNKQARIVLQNIYLIYKIWCIIVV